MLNVEQLKSVLTGDIPLEKDNMPIAVDCGTMPYRDALALQEELVAHTQKEGLPGVLLFVEHPPVITLGIRKPHNQLVSSASQIRQEGIEVVPIRRGGGSTAHNPGQLVIYPVFKLSALGFRVAPYVRYLEHVGMEILSSLGITARRIHRYPGLWINGRKIASVGVQLNQGITMHGIAINLWNDLSIFQHIIACGIDGVTMTNAEEEGGKRVSSSEVKKTAETACYSLLPQKAGKQTERETE